MNLDHLSTVIRPRTNAEAIDLGFRLAASHFFACWPLILAIMLVVTLPAYWLGHESESIWMYLFIWWLKPLWEPITLIVLSRRIFGENLTHRQTLALWFKQSWWQMLLNLTWRRFSITRNFDLSVSLLEKLSGKARRHRLNALTGDNITSTIALIVLGSLTEMVILFVLIFGSEMIFSFKYLQGPGYLDKYITILSYFGGLLAMSMVAPFFTATGFSLYLNRRTRLEAWDIELQFKQMSERLAKRGTTLILMLLLALPPLFSMTPVIAAEEISKAEARHIILESMTGTEFYKEEKQKTVVPYKTEHAQSSSSLDKFIKWLSEYLSKFFTSDGKQVSYSGVAEFVRIFVWVIAALIVIYLVWRYLDYLPQWRQMRGKTANKETVPEQLFGLDIRQHSLPSDIPAEALKAWEAGNAREAFSLLYRGALSHCVTKFELNFQNYHTEGDCVAIVTQSKPTMHHYFADLTRHWVTVAYGHQTPNLNFAKFCDEWRQHYSGATHVLSK